MIHDATLDRTTDAVGPVAARTAAELARIDAGHAFDAAAGFPFRGRGVGVPRLAEVLELAAHVPVIVEIKGDDPTTARRVVETIRAAGAESRVVIGGFSSAVLAVVRQAMPACVTSASMAEVQAAMRRALFRLRPRPTGYQLFQMPLRLKGRRVLTPSFVRLARRAGLPVQAWIVDEEEDMRVLVEWGVAGLISDRPDRAVAVAAVRDRGLLESSSSVKHV